LGQDDMGHDSATPVLGVIGAGNYGAGVLIPALRAAGARLKTVVSSGGVTGAQAGRRFGFEQVSTDSNALLRDAEIDTVIVATRHDSHARFVSQTLTAGKHVFVEKPIAIDREGLGLIERAHRNSTCQPVLMVGFNRRFAPHTVKVKSLLEGVREPKYFVMTVNAGAIPPEHWTQKLDVGGGRIIGEACHFIDLLRFLVAHPVVDLRVSALPAMPGAPQVRDNVSITLTFADGSIGTVHYVACGHKAFPKERLEVFCAGRVLQLDNFRRLWAFGWSGFSGSRLWRQDKGNQACAAAFIDAVRSGRSSPIPFEELVEVADLTFRALEQLSAAATR